MSNREIVESYDLVVIGGGMAGICASIAAARLGCKVALVHDRPVLGGNASSEIRVSISGADSRFKNARETGILEELRLEYRFRDHDVDVNGEINSIWDMILWEWVTRETNLKLYLNTPATHAIMKDDNTIEAIKTRQMGTEKEFRLEGDIFIDSSGDGYIAYKAGADFRMGREAQHEFNESIAPEIADNLTLGSSLLFESKNMGRPVKFTPPDWAYDYPSDDSFPFRGHNRITSGFWWIEYGGELNTITDNDEIRDELWKVLFGVWDHIKNHGDHGAENYALDWVGTIPGKRESRRFMGDHVLTQNDIESANPFPDRVAYGGWSIDLHPPKGIYSPGKPAEFNGFPNLYSIPFRCLYSKNITNLMMAGRNISTTHVAFGSTRVMATCAIEGQAAGTAASLCKKYNVLPREVYGSHISELQQQLLKDDCYILDMKNTDDADLALKATVTASSFDSGDYMPQNVVNGVARSQGDKSNMWMSDAGESIPQYIELDFGKQVEFNTLCLTFDTNLNKLPHLGAAPECVKDYAISFHNGNSWVNILTVKDNHQRHRKHKFSDVTTHPVVSQKLRIEIQATNGADTAKIFEVRVYKD
jgi:hypothetical protein